MSGPCRLCQLASEEEVPPGGWVLRDDAWFSCVLPGYEVPGWLVVGMDRHAEGIDAMDPAEAAAFGVVVQGVGAALRQVTGAERIYLVGFGEEHPHVHFMLAARPPQSEGEPIGPGYLARREELRNPAEAVRTADAVRAALATTTPER